jgi:P pilus assembly chaperone PapD
VRVANRAPAATDAEKSWRLVFEEVPDASPVQTNTLRVALKISIPVFGIAPGARHELAFATRRSADGKAELVATNSGLAHVQLTDFDMLGPDGAVVTRITGSRYLLPGASAAWPVTLPAGLAAGGTLRVRGHSDRGELAAEVAAAPKTP